MITRIKLRNFKAFKEVEIFPTSINLFTGINGMGKSSFIQALLLLRQSGASLLPEYSGLQLKGEIIEIGKGKDAYNIYADNDFISFEIDSDSVPYLNLSYRFIAENDVLPLDAGMPNDYNNPGDVSLFTSNFQYLKADRTIPEHSYRSKLNSVLSQNFLGYKGENTPLYIAINKLEPLKIESVKHPNAESNTLIAHLDAWMNEITPGTHVISTYYNELDIVKLGYKFDSEDDTTPEFSAVNVGFGFTYTLPVITAILSAKSGDLIIIENPESHLHPKGQVKLGELFSRAANDGVQIIIESHSDHLLNGIRVAVKNKLVESKKVSVFYFERSAASKEHSTNIIQPLIDDDGRIDSWPENFFDQWENTLMDLI